METQMIKTDKVKRALETAGWDMEKELEGLSSESSTFELPRVRIDHNDKGKHRMYIDAGESYLDDESQEIEIPGNKLTAVVFAFQNIRAFWEEGQDLPTCSAIDDLPMGQEPLAGNCRHCEYGNFGQGKCKPKARLLLLAKIGDEVKPLLFNLSPPSIKHWSAHKKKLTRSNLPVVAVNTTFELEDVRRNNYRWAEVVLNMDGIASKEMLMMAKTARTEFETLTKRISDADFSDSGDKQPS